MGAKKKCPYSRCDEIKIKGREGGKVREGQEKEECDETEDYQHSISSQRKCVCLFVVSTCMFSVCVTVSGYDHDARERCLRLRDRKHTKDNFTESISILLICINNLTLGCRTVRAE